MDYMLKSSDERVVINDFVQGDPLSEENLDKTLELVSNLRKVDSANPCKMGVSDVKNSDEIRLSFPDKTIWIYSGYNYQKIMRQLPNLATKDNYNMYKRQRIILQCNVMVDGKYIDSKRDITLKWRGSTNQKVIDIKETIRQNKIILYCD